MKTKLNTWEPKVFLQTEKDGIYVRAVAEYNDGKILYYNFEGCVTTNTHEAFISAKCWAGTLNEDETKPAKDDCTQLPKGRFATKEDIEMGLIHIREQLAFSKKLRTSKDPKLQDEWLEKETQKLLENKQTLEHKLAPRNPTTMEF